MNFVSKLTTLFSRMSSPVPLGLAGLDPAGTGGLARLMRVGVGAPGSTLGTVKFGVSADGAPAGNCCIVRRSENNGSGLDPVVLSLGKRLGTRKYSTWAQLAVMKNCRLAKFEFNGSRIESG